MAEEQLAYRPEQILQRFPIGRTALYELIASGELPSFKIGRARFVTRQDLLDFMDRSVAEQSTKTPA
jgi:excisionase family DNA binding protein